MELALATGLPAVGCHECPLAKLMDGGERVRIGQRVAPGCLDLVVTTADKVAVFASALSMMANPLQLVYGFEKLSQTVIAVYPKSWIVASPFRCVVYGIPRHHEIVIRICKQDLDVGVL